MPCSQLPVTVKNILNSFFKQLRRGSRKPRHPAGSAFGKYFELYFNNLSF